jgi:asparagine synthase (glutamine-hydrolysing)
VCGIVGIRNFDDTPVAHETLKRMTTELIHRGPDDNGIWTEGPVGMGHTRLSIIDVGGSRQPMSTPAGTAHLVFNGEILNYRQLRRELRYPFRTNGDTEVLLALYDSRGPDAVTALRGQFAYALHDSRTGETHLFRDRLGILPLYYYADDSLFAFASELKALLPAIGAVRVDEASLDDYLTDRAVPGPHTLIENVRKVPPGTHLVVRANGTIRLSAFWKLPVESHVRNVSPRAAVDLVEAALTDSVREALVADVPVGVNLSGGVDSSLITALATREVAVGSLNTFSAAFGDPRTDETVYAREVAALCRTEHHEVVVRPDDFQQMWSVLSWHRDAPLSEPSEVAIFRLAQLARQHVKVALCGEGSDEIFGGYPKYRFADVTRWPTPLPWLPAGWLEQHLPADKTRLRIAVRALSEKGYPERMRGWFASFTERERTVLLGRPPSRDSLGPYLDGRGDALNRMLYADLRTWLVDNLLERNDRMSMAASLELRPPYLDHRLVELGFTLPRAVKVRGGTTKWVLKEVARRHLPSVIVDRQKVGFKVPLDAWFRTGLRDMAFDLLTGPSSFVGTNFNRPAVQSLLDAHSSGQRDEQQRIWTLLSLEIWHREVLRRCAMLTAA